MIKKNFGEEGAKLTADSHDWALHRVGEISKELGIDCEYRILPGYNVSQYTKGTKEHADEIAELKEEIPICQKIGLDAKFVEDFKIKGWDGEPDQRDAAVFGRQATFHPTKYLNGVLKWLQKQPNFQCYTRSRVHTCSEKGLHVPIIDTHIGKKGVKVETVTGRTVMCNHAVQATVVPLQLLSIIAEMEYNRTYCIAIRIPKGTVEDALIYDNADKYKYVRMTQCDDKDDYMVVGGCDHAVGQEDEQQQRYKELETWTRERFTKAGSVDYKWSGQIFEPEDYMAFIGRNSGNDRIYIVTGDSGNGLTHGVLAGKLLTDLILGVDNPWAKIYDPKRKTSLLKELPSIVKHDLQVNAQYKRWAQNDIEDIASLPKGKGGVLNPTGKLPRAVYKDQDGKVSEFSALCPHMHGIVCWNDDEKSFDCPVHGSRFSKDGMAICGPTKGGLNAWNEEGKAKQEVMWEQAS